jgi:hypothetical protein
MNEMPPEGTPISLAVIEDRRNSQTDKHDHRIVRTGPLQSTNMMPGQRVARSRRAFALDLGDGRSRKTSSSACCGTTGGTVGGPRVATS